MRCADSRALRRGSIQVASRPNQTGAHGRDRPPASGRHRRAGGEIGAAGRYAASAEHLFEVDSARVNGDSSGVLNGANDPPNVRELSEKETLEVVDLVRKEFNVDDKRTDVFAFFAKYSR